MAMMVTIAPIMAAVDGVTTPAMTPIALGRCFGRSERQSSKPEDTHDHCLYMCHVKTLLALEAARLPKVIDGFYYDGRNVAHLT
jgi:hypothetical protein